MQQSTKHPAQQTEDDVGQTVQKNILNASF